MINWGDIMSFLDIELINLINEKYTLNDIREKLGLSHSQIYDLFYKLRCGGVGFERKYYCDGEIIYTLDETDSDNKNSVNLITGEGTDTFRAMVISDLHIGSIYDNIDSFYKIYNYCNVNDIHTIIIVGDFLDGINIGRMECKRHSNPLEQIKYAIKNYPFDKNILNFCIFGNHDYDFLLSFNLNLADYLYDFRHDIVPLGFGRGTINIKNDKILLAHPLCIGTDYVHELTSNYLLLKGHHHVAKNIIGTNGNCSISIPTLSNLFVTDDVFLPGAIDLSIKFRGGFFDMIYYKQLMVNDRVHIVNSTQLSIGHAKNRKFDLPVMNEEDFSKRRVLKK